MYLLDTDVVSELRRPHTHPAIVHRLTVVTRNARDIAQLGVDLLNPFEYESGVRR